MEAKASPISDIRPKNVGIVAIDIFFPRQYVTQEALEKHDQVSAGKYTIGLGQTELAFCSPCEDIYSVTLSAVSRFMEEHKLSYSDIGRLEVATETIIDHSKSIKTVLMQLFTESGNTDIEGVDCMNACYAGTNALFNSVAWVESSSWTQKYALVVAADIAEYAAGPARPTGGCGVVVMLVGPNAPLALEPGLRASHMEHVWDFYKPDPASPYPVVDGHYSNTCYLRALDTCYGRYADRFKAQTGQAFDLTQTAHVVFHAPYNKLVQKSFARLSYQDALRDAANPQSAAVLAPFKDVTKDESYTHTALEKAFVAASKDAYARQVGPSTLLPQRLGNMYTASLYAGLVSLVHNLQDKLAGQRVLLFSYGSGLASSMFSIRVTDDESTRSALRANAKASALSERLSTRTLRDPAFFNEIMSVREKLHKTLTFDPVAPSEGDLWSGSFYLIKKDEKGRRFYQRAATVVSA